MNSEKPKITGIIPAAGNASRISPLPCSKEIFPVGFTVGHNRDKPEVKAAASYLLESFHQAGAELSYMVIREDKWDIPKYYRSGLHPGCRIAYVVSGATPGVPFTIDQVYPFVTAHTILFGFPDIIFKPRNAFAQLLKRQIKTGGDVVLGLFKAVNPQKMDMVRLDDQNRVEQIEIKPRETDLLYTWIIAVWTGKFSDYLHEFLTGFESFNSPLKKQNKDRELFIGDVIRQAIEDGLKVEAVLFPEGKYIDIGTIPDLQKAMTRLSW